MSKMFYLILGGGLVVLFFWTARQNLVLDNVFEATYDFKKPSPFITSLSPGDRIEDRSLGPDGRTYQTMIDEPVYFRVRSPRSFKRGLITIRYQNDQQTIFRLGGLVNRAKNQFDLETLENREKGEAFFRQEGDWKIGQAEFDLSRFENPDGRTYTFVLSAPGLARAGNKILVSEISARLVR